MIFTLTDRAITKFKKDLEKRGTPDSYIRFGIKSGGCSGYEYLFMYADQLGTHEKVYDFNGLKFIVDDKSALFISGTVIDFETGIQNHGLKISNPNVKTSCGCGMSITL